MWVRKRIDIGWSDIAYGIMRSCWSGNRAAIRSRIEQDWSEADDALACLSVRTGFDLMLKQLRWNEGSEILFSALTIPDMVRIAEHHKLQAVPVDLDVTNLAPNLDLLRDAISSRTKAIVVAHLFGTRVDLSPIIEIAKEHDLLVIEDCAQAYAGHGYRGHPDVDVSMFSFGPIKTCSSLAGAVFRVHDPELLQLMREAHDQYIVQRRWTYFRRLLKFTAIKVASTRPMMTMVAKSCRLMGSNHDEFSNRAAKGFAGPDFFARIRHQPSNTLLSMLERRLRTYDEKKLEVRSSHGDLLSRELHDLVPRPGSEAEMNNFWVFPIVVENPEEVLEALWRAGFDATQGDSMRVVEAPDHRPDLEATDTKETVARMIYLPFYPEMSERSLRKMARVLLDACGVSDQPRRRRRSLASRIRFNVNEKPTVASDRRWRNRRIGKLRGRRQNSKLTETRKH